MFVALGRRKTHRVAGCERATQHAEPSAQAPAAKVTIEVMVVHATNAHTRVDSRLKRLLFELFARLNFLARRLRCRDF